MAEHKNPGRVAGGRKAAHTAKQRYGSEFHREIGSLGGRSTAARHGGPFFEAIGRTGGKG